MAPTYRPHVPSLPGVYALRCNANGKQYVGSAQRMKARVGRHFIDLRAGQHPNPNLQASFDKYGEGAFESRVLLRCSAANLLFYEQRALDRLRPEFNVARDARAPNRGRKFSAAVRAKVSASLRGNTRTLGYKQSDETRAKLSAMRKGVKTGRPPTVTAESRAKISAAHKGRTHTPEHRARVSAAKILWWAERKRGEHAAA